MEGGVAVGASLHHSELARARVRLSCRRHGKREESIAKLDYSLLSDMPLSLNNTPDSPAIASLGPPLEAEGSRPPGEPKIPCKTEMPRAGFEPAAYSLGGSRSVQLSYRGERWRYRF